MANTLLSRRFSEVWDDFVREVELASLEIDPDEVFADVRDDVPGREARM